MPTFRDPMPSRPPPRPRRIGSAVLPACLGFAAGAIFWHFVGFWDFVGRVVLAHPAQVAGQLAGPTVVMIASPEATAKCARLTLDRSGGHTELAPCEDETGPTSDKSLTRGDLSTAVIPPDAGQPIPPGASSAGTGPGN